MRSAGELVGGVDRTRGWLEREIESEYQQIRDATLADPEKTFTNDDFERAVERPQDVRAAARRVRHQRSERGASAAVKRSGCRDSLQAPILVTTLRPVRYHFAASTTGAGVSEALNLQIGGNWAFLE